MEITTVRIRKIEAEGKLKAVASVTFDNELVCLAEKRQKVSLRT
jgi:DNA-binding cell septation regulator SpoVG